ncbi:cytochrome P450 6g1-like [Folsomia candida]|nr:cytochrome P450 6g1-like [Folsomia candida]
MSKPAPPRSALNTFLALYLVLPLITLLSWIFKNPSVEKYLASCGVLYFSDVPGSFVPEFLKGNGPAQYVSGLYERLKVDKSYLGGFTLFNKTYYVTRDPGLIREICVKDVTQIERTESTLSFAGDYIISKSLVYLQGDHWKKTRAKFDRGFTPSKIKHNFAQINHVGRNLVEYFNHEMDPAGSLVCDLNLPIHKYSLDVVASVTLNLDTVCLKTREPSRFEQISDRVYTSFDKFTDWVKPMFILWLPRVTNYFRVTIMDKEIGTFYGDVAQAKIQSEGGAGKKNLNDFVHLIHSSYKELYGREAIGRGANGRGAIGREAIGRGANGREEDEKDFIISNLYTLVLTGYETTEVVLAMCAYELALNPNVQRRLRDEIKDVLG